MSDSDIVKREWTEFHDLHLKIRENVQSMAAQKKLLVSSSSNDDHAQGKREIDRLYRESLKMFAYLQSLRHKCLSRREHLQSQLNEICAGLNAKTLGIKNHEYDQMDTMKQIAICRHHQCQNSAPVLVSVAEFYAQNPDLQPNIGDAHVEHTKRLQHELQQRKQLQDDLKDTTQLLEDRRVELGQKQTFLGSIKSNISSVFDAMKPLQTYMQLPSTMLCPNEAEIDSLPPPLFAVYQALVTQLHCSAELDQHTVVTIVTRARARTCDVVLNGEVEVEVATGITNSQRKRKFDAMTVSDTSQEEADTETAAVAAEPEDAVPVVEDVSSSSNAERGDERGDDSASLLEDGEIGAAATASMEPPRKRVRTSARRSKDKERDSHRESERERDRDRDSKKRRKNRPSSSSKKHKQAQAQETSNATTTTATTAEVVVAIAGEDVQATQEPVYGLSASVDALLDGYQIRVCFQNIGMALEFLYCAKFNLVLVCVQRQRARKLVPADAIASEHNTDVVIANAAATEWQYVDGTLFMDLFDGHQLIELPSMLAAPRRLLGNGNIIPFFSAYSWAQELGGCYVFGAQSTSSSTLTTRSIVNLQSLSDALRHRKQHRTSVHQQIKQWLRCVGNRSEYASFVSTQLLPKIHVQNVNKPQNLSVPKNAVIAFKKLQPAEAAAVVCPHVDNQYKTYFEIGLQRDEYRLQCVVEIAPKYPRPGSLAFHVRSVRRHDEQQPPSYVNACRNMEEKLNVNLGECTEDTHQHWLLSIMIYRLQICFDTYVDSMQTQQLEEAPQTRFGDVTFRRHRGRDRRLQFY